MLTAAQRLGMTLLVWTAITAQAHAGNDRDEATLHNRRGVAYYEMGKYEQAVAEFEQAYLLYPGDSVLYNLAQAHRKLDHCEQALDYYRRFLDRNPGSPLVVEIRALLPELERACDVKFVKPAGVEANRDATDARPPPAPRLVEPPHPAPARPAVTPAIPGVEPSAAPSSNAMLSKRSAAPAPGLRLRVAAAAGGLFAGGMSVTPVGVTAGVVMRPGALPVDLGAAADVARFAWSSFGGQGNSTVVSLMATAGAMRRTGGFGLHLEVGVGFMAITGTNHGHPLRSRSRPQGGSSTIGPRAQLGAFVDRELTPGWAVRAGVTGAGAWMAALRGGTIGELRLAVGLEYRP